MIRFVDDFIISHLSNMIILYSAHQEVNVNQFTSKKQKEQVKLLRKEVDILSHLQHPNIIAYLGAEFTDVFIFIFIFF